MPRFSPSRLALRWWIIGLVTLGTILNYLARSTLSVAAPTLKAEFGMTTQQYSWVVLAFQGSYTVMQSVAGAVLDALGTRLGFLLFPGRLSPPCVGSPGRPSAWRRWRGRFRR